MIAPHHRRRSPIVVALTMAVAAWSAHGSPLSAAEPELVLTALAPRSTASGETLFTLLPPARIGVIAANAYTDPAMWWEKYHEFEVGEIGTGVAIGDCDGDGRPDLVLASKTGSVQLFRNLGAWKFENITAAAGLAAEPDTGIVESSLAWMRRAAGQDAAGPASGRGWTQGVALADINNDWQLDLYVCRFGAPNLLYVNQGHGKFKEEAAARGLALMDASGMAAFGDYDRDGWLDVYVHTNLLDAVKQPAGTPDRLFHNDGSGHFTEVSAQAGIRGAAQAHSATWWDYDHDGWPDLYVANDFAPADKLYHNNRDGTFTDVIDAALPHTPFSSMGADLGDVNNDGLIDFLVADMAATTPEKDQRGMAESRARNDRDAPPGTAAQYPRNALYLATGGPRLREAACQTGLAATDWTWSVRLEDLDNDGRLDVHITNGMFRESHNLDLLSAVMAAETPAERVRLVRASPVLAESNLAFRNVGQLHFEPVGPQWGLDQVGVSFGAAFGDLDGDGDLDLVYANYDAGPTVLRNDCATGHRVTIALHGTASNRLGVGAVVRIESASGPQVRQLSLARGYLSTSEPILHFGLGDDRVIDRLTVTWPSGREQTFTGIAADQHLEITEPASAAQIRAPAAKPAPQFAAVGATRGLDWSPRAAPLDEIARQPLLPLRQNQQGPALAIGDLNGNGTDELWIGGTTLDAGRICAQRANGDWTDAEISSVQAGAVDDGPALWVEVNGDGRPDLLVTRGGVRAAAGSPVYQPELRLNAGDGTFIVAPPGTLPAFPVSVGALAAADFDHNGTLDVFLGGRVQPGDYPATPTSALWVNRGERYEDLTATLAPALATIGLVTSAVWSDVDDDGWVDLLVALEWGGVHHFHNERGERFTDQSGPAGFSIVGTGWWSSIAAADFNGDGRLDYAVGNLGLNTPYQASPASPAVLLTGEFGEGTGPQLLEARTFAGQLFPWRTRGELARVVPGLRKRFRKNDDYARAPLEAIVGAERLAGATRLVATEFRSGVWLSQPNGTYRFASLPAEAQLSPIFGLVAGDFDGDGHADLYAVQNSSAPAPTMGRFDGGLSQLLLGDGRGNFRAVAPEVSGLVVPGNARALVVTDLNGDAWPDFVVSQAGGPTLAFVNQRTVTGHCLAIRLRGQPGNPTAVGARLTVESQDGTQATAEVGAGGGHWSQSTAALYFGGAPDNPVRSVQVRWPDGKITRHLIPRDVTQLTLEQPTP